MRDFQIINGVLAKYRGHETHVVIPDGVTRIGRKAFSGSRDFVESLVIPDGVTELGNSAFANMTKLTAVILPGSLKVVPLRAFEGCERLQSVAFPEALESIEEKAFSDCISLRSVTFAGGIMTIGAEAFYGCTELRAIAIPDGVRTIRKGAFGGIPGLTVRGKNGTAAKHYALGEQIAFEEETEIFIRDGILVYCSGLPSHFAVPDTVTTISPLAFQGCDSLVSVTIPGRVKQIPNGLFKGHASLQRVVLDEGVEEIGSRAFYEYEGYSAPVWVSFLYVIPFAAAIIICLLLAAYFGKKSK